MLRLFSNIPLPAHVLLLLLIIALRLPSLIGGYYLHDESLYMVCAERLTHGGSIYVDAWFAGPPLIVGIYYSFICIFGSSALFAIRLFACVYIYLSAVYFNGMLMEYKPFKRYPLLPSFLFVFLVSTPWYAQEFGPTLFAIFPVLVSFHAIIKLDEGRNHSYGLLFNSGILMALCILASYKAVFILGGIVLTYLILKSPRLDHFFSLIGGVLVVLLGFLLFLFWGGMFEEFWDIGALYYLDRIGFRENEMYVYELRRTLMTGLMSWGIFVILAAFTYMHYRVRFYSYVVKIRSLESTMNMWLIVVSIALIFKLRRLDTQDFILLIPPIVFYANKAFDFQWVHKLRIAIMLISLAMPIYMYMSYWGLAFPHSMSLARPLAEDTYLHGGNWQDFDLGEPIRRYFYDAEINHGIWIMGDKPELYLTLENRCANKYTDFRIVYNKFSVLPHFNDEKSVSKAERESEIFRQFLLTPPDYIIDLHKKFPYLQHRFPGLLERYVGEEVGDYMVYKAETLRSPAF